MRQHILRQSHHSIVGLVGFFLTEAEGAAG